MITGAVRFVAMGTAVSIGHVRGLAAMCDDLDWEPGLERHALKRAAFAMLCAAFVWGFAPTASGALWPPPDSPRVRAWPGGEDPS